MSGVRSSDLFAIDKARDGRLQHPSALEQRVENALAQLPGIAWEREHEVPFDEGKWFVDFLVVTPRGRIALEVQGTWGHSRRPASKGTLPARPPRARFRAP